MRDSYERRVTRGAKLLDSKEPNWYQHIDTKKLVMYNSCKCILGQLHGNYWDSDTVKSLDDYGSFYDEDKSIKYGFNYVGMFGTKRAKYSIAKLQSLWQREIKIRLNKQKDC